MSRVPRIRFKGFEEDWEQRKLNEIVSYHSSNLTASDANDIGKYDLYDANSIIGKTDVEPVKSEYITIVKDGAGVGRIRRMPENTMFIGTMGGLKVTKSYTDFIYSLLTIFELCKEYSGSTIPHIYFKDYGNNEYLIPTEKEQQKVGEYFAKIDHLITLHQRKLEKLKIIKKSMLENLFPKNEEKTPRIRFSGFTEDWEQRKLGEVANIVGGGTPSTSNEKYWDGNIDWYAPAEIGEQIYAFGSIRKITEEGLKHSSAKLLPAFKTVLFTSRAGIGNMAVLQKDGATNQGFQSIVCNDSLVPYFVFSMGFQIKKKAERVAAGSTFSEISGKQLCDLEIMVTTDKEQLKIGSYFESLDHLITLHQSKLEKLQKIKKSMLESMFV